METTGQQAALNLHQLAVHAADHHVTLIQLQVETYQHRLHQMSIAYQTSIDKQTETRP
jgi:hypothetical protein